MASLLKEKLEAKGIQVLMTRTSQDVDISNKERATFANNHKANLFLRLHADGSENPKRKWICCIDTGRRKSVYERDLCGKSSNLSNDC